jgi:hypothetical protein
MYASVGPGLGVTSIRSGESVFVGAAAVASKGERVEVGPSTGSVFGVAVGFGVSQLASPFQKRKAPATKTIKRASRPKVRMTGDLRGDILVLIILFEVVVK